jgi:hypothetical protein
VANDPARAAYFTKGDFLLAPFSGATVAAGSGHATCPFVLRVGLIVASIGSVARTVSIAIHFWNVIAIRPKQQLLPHFRKARGAILAVEVVE